MGAQQKSLHYVLLQHKDVLKVYLEDPDLPVRFLPGDVCVGRGELPLSDKAAAFLEILRAPTYKRPKGLRGLDCSAADAFLEVVSLAVGAGFVSAQEWYEKKAK